MLERTISPYGSYGPETLDMTSEGLEEMFEGDSADINKNSGTPLQGDYLGVIIDLRFRICILEFVF